MSAETPPYVEAHDLLRGKNVIVTAAAGTGIGFAVARRCLEEGARLMRRFHTTSTIRELWASGRLKCSCARLLLGRKPRVVSCAWDRLAGSA